MDAAFNNTQNNYEKEMEYLKMQLMRSSKHTLDSSFSRWHLSNKLINENEKYQEFSHQLKQDFLRIYSLVSEANVISNEMQEEINYNVILQIPISYLKLSERNINHLCEVAVEVKQENSIVQIWDTEKFELKFDDMKAIYQRWKISGNKKEELKQNNPFFDDESNSFIGVANIHLKALFYNSKLDYIVPIINTRGETFGSLYVVLDQTESSSMKNLSDFQINSTTQGSMSEGISADIDEQSLSTSQPSLEDEGIYELPTLSNGKNEQITVKFAIKEVRGLPKTDAEHVMCRYTFINPKLDQTIISKEFSDNDLEQNSRIFSFNHENEYTFPITDQFLSTCLESAISVEVWYQHKPKLQSIDMTENNKLHRSNAEVREISQRWKEAKRHIHFSIEIQELNALGQWEPVEVDALEQILSGGVYRLKQGQSKRIATRLRVLPRSDPMPLLLHAIRSVEIGSISRRKIDAPRHLDSYQDEDLQHLRNEWLNLIEKQKLYLESQVNILSEQTDRTENDIQKENILLKQLVRLTEQRNIAMFPPPGSGIPGAPASWNPPPTNEVHRPLIFLNLNSVNINTSSNTAGLQSTLNEENKTRMFSLPLIQNASDEIRAVAQWDPSIHESTDLNQVTAQDSVIYLIVKIIVLISEPVQMEVVLRKRIAVTMNKAEGWLSGKIFKNLLGYKTYKRTSVVYEIVSNIPEKLHTIEDSNKTNSQYLSEDSIEKYIQYASTIDSILLLDSLRQEVLLVENSAKKQTIRKATSAPNIIIPHRKKTNIFHSPINLRREILDQQSSSIPNEPISSSNQSELNSSTPSMLSRLLFIEEEQLQPIQKSTFQIKHTIDLDDNKQEDNKNTLEEKYLLISSQSPKQIIPNNNIGSRVIVNTGHQIFNKTGTVRFIGEISVREGIWYGIELVEAVGKNNGSLDGHIYFECPDKHGVFVRRDKIQFID